MTVGSETVLLTFLLFCRIGGCLMLMPGFASPRVPVQVRLFLAIAATLALAPLLVPTLQAALPRLASATALEVLFSETAIGATIGLMGRLFFLALQFGAATIAMFIGFSNAADPPIEDVESLPAVSTLVTLTATVFFFLADQHWEVFRALVASYAVLPAGSAFSAQSNLTQVTDVLLASFVLALQVSSPFVIYSLIINFTFGILNKLTPQIPVYFISLPFVIAGGFFLLFFSVGEILHVFISEFTRWLEKG